MRKQSLIILGIIIAGSISSIAYATSTVITDSGITTSSLTTNSLTVNGLCTGCGGEGSFTHYSLIINKTLTRLSGTTNNGIVEALIANDASSQLRYESGTGVLFFIDPSGNLINAYENSYSFLATALHQSQTGIYKIAWADNNGTIYIYKNNVFLQSISIGITNGKNGFIGAADESMINISPNGEYIILGGIDTTNSNVRFNIWQGS